ncbi:hypothetical protein BJY52DRAFT_1253594 [Lactarius psammicola]|nr:hypothetical protein BJY52DRAFT_1253594 [Lactarius psammicola]
MSTRREDLFLTPASAAPTRTACRAAAKKAHWLSTVRVPGPRANLAIGPWPPAVFQKSPLVPVSPVSTETARPPSRRNEPSPPVVRPPVTQAPAEAMPPRPESPLAHARRGAPGHNVPPARIVSSDTTHTLSIALPRPGGAPLAPEMITVSARRGGRLAVVADAWHLEHDCHYEWYFALPSKEVDLGAVKACFGEDGTLVIDVPRRPPRSGTRFV